jgi:hypothetical protein
LGYDRRDPGRPGLVPHSTVSEVKVEPSTVQVSPISSRRRAVVDRRAPIEQRDRALAGRVEEVTDLRILNVTEAAVEVLR